jgi:hypothetical protein
MIAAPLLNLDAVVTGPDTPERWASARNLMRALAAVPNP